jgi:hypothetical protein
MNQLVTAEINKTAAIVLELSENLLGHGHTVWMVSCYSSPEMAQFMKSKENWLCWNFTC